MIDQTDNIIIGTRAKDIQPFAGRAPHPTLLGRQNPKVRTAGIVEFRGGKIYKVDNASGHFKPSNESLHIAEDLFKSKFVQKSFASDFQGFVPYTK